MATVKRKSLAMSGSTWGTWFNSLECSLISASGSVITVDNAFSFTKENYKLTCKQGSTVIFEMTCNNPCTVTVCCSDSLVYIQCSDPQNRRCFFVYEKLPENTLLGYYSSGNGTGIAYKPITDLTFTDINTGIVYTHGARLNFTAGFGKICFAEDTLFQDGVRDMADPNFISCTTVTANQVYAFSLSNFYSVGAHTLVRMDLD